VVVADENDDIIFACGASKTQQRSMLAMMAALFIFEKTLELAFCER
jgi:hypothetical protein